MCARFRPEESLAPSGSFTKSYVSLCGDRNFWSEGTNPTNAASVLRIMSITQIGNDFLITWMTGVGKTNILQLSQTDSSGGLSTTFTDLFTVPYTTGTPTNYTDAGAATNAPARYYRVRLGP